MSLCREYVTSGTVNVKQASSNRLFRKFHSLLFNISYIVYNEATKSFEQQTNNSLHHRVLIAHIFVVR